MSTVITKKLTKRGKAEYLYMNTTKDQKSIISPYKGKIIKRENIPYLYSRMESSRMAGYCTSSSPTSSIASITQLPSDNGTIVHNDMHALNIQNHNSLC